MDKLRLPGGRSACWDGLKRASTMVVAAVPTLRWTDAVRAADQCVCAEAFFRGVCTGVMWGPLTKWGATTPIDMLIATSAAVAEGLCHAFR